MTDAMAAMARYLAGKPAPISREGLTAHYDFDGSLTDTSGQLSARPHAERRSGFRSGTGEPRRYFRRPDAGHSRAASAISKSDQPFTIAFWLRYGGSKAADADLREDRFAARLAAAGRSGWTNRCWLTSRSARRQ